jgi:hypothetical protein
VASEADRCGAGSLASGRESWVGLGRGDTFRRFDSEDVRKGHASLFNYCPRRLWTPETWTNSWQKQKRVEDAKQAGAVPAANVSSSTPNKSSSTSQTVSLSPCRKSHEPVRWLHGDIEPGHGRLAACDVEIT